MTTARYAVHKMIQDLMRDPARAAAFAAEPEATFEEYGLVEDERALLRDGSPVALHTLGVHPNLQMKYARLRAGPQPAPGPNEGPLAAYLDRILER
jgi:Aromatic-ring-opening dioxygenase LigAB, LigA subunit